MPKKKRSGTQKKSKAVPDTVVLLPDALLKRYKKNVNRNKNVNVNIIKNVVNVPAPKKSRRRTSKATPKSGPLRAQGPGMLFSSPPVTIQSPYYGNPPYPVQPLMSRPVIPGIYADPDSHRVNIATDTRAIPIVSNENPNNLAPVNNQARLVPSLVPTGITLTAYDDSYETPQDISMGLDKVLSNINPFGGINKVRADDLFPVLFGANDPGIEADVDEKQEAVSSGPAVSSVGIREEGPSGIVYRMGPGDSLPEPPEGYLYAMAVSGRPSIIMPNPSAEDPNKVRRIGATEHGMPLYRKKAQKPQVSVASLAASLAAAAAAAPSAPLGWTEWVNANRIYDQGRKYDRNKLKYGKDAAERYMIHSRENYQRYLRGEPPIPFE